MAPLVAAYLSHFYFYFFIFINIITVNIITKHMSCTCRLVRLYLLLWSSLDHIGSTVSGYTILVPERKLQRGLADLESAVVSQIKFGLNY